MCKDSFIIQLKWQRGRCFSNRGLTQFHESYTRRADTGVNEAANAAEFADARVARKQINKCRAVEDIAKSAAAAAQRRAADAASEDN